jgi:hypothetical protein
MSGPNGPPINQIIAQAGPLIQGLLQGGGPEPQPMPTPPPPGGQSVDAPAPAPPPMPTGGMPPGGGPPPQAMLQALQARMGGGQPNA